MFTGLVEEIGWVRRRQRSGRFQRLEIGAERILSDLRQGDSVNIDGVCQTVVDRSPASFTVESIEATLNRTTLGELQVGRKVNLERAMQADGRLGGHLVLGHVDGVGRLVRIAPGQANWVFAVEPPAGLEQYLAARGSIAVDGISLTVAEVDERGFTVAVIPHTFEHTTLAERRVGDGVNLEVDIIARYVERLLSAGRPAAGLTLQRLRQMGY
jgi:riboflavin synthase